MLLYIIFYLYIILFVNIIVIWVWKTTMAVSVKTPEQNRFSTKQVKSPLRKAEKNCNFTYHWMYGICFRWL